MNEEVKQLSNSGLQLALDTLKELRKQEQSNILISPVSLHVALSVLYAGSKTVTKTEFKKVLYLEKFPDDLKVYGIMKILVELLENITETNLQLHLATRLLLQSGMPLVEDFQKIAQTNYYCDVQEVTFNDQTRKELNAWIETKTNQKIIDAIEEDVFRDAILFLVNVVYFKGNWDKPFDPNFTKPQDFHLNSKSKVIVEMMHGEAEFDIGTSDELKCKILEMTYAEGKVSMYVILPHETEGLAQLENALNAQSFSALIGATQKQKVSVMLPKFKMGSSLKLEAILSKIGLSTLFSHSADLSGITGQKSLFVSHVIHKTFMDVNEEGTEGAAVTIVSGTKVLVETFIADHPFLIAIQHKHTDAILLFGRVLNPVM